MINRDNLKKALDELNKYKKSKTKKYNFYSFDNILKNYNFDVFFSVATRTTGKTTAVQRDIILQDFYEHGYQFVKLCRTKEELRPNQQSDWWTEIVKRVLNKYDIDIRYKNGRYVINSLEEHTTDGVLNEGKFFKTGQVIGYVVPVLREQSYKSLNYERCYNIIFEEFAKSSDYGYHIGEIEYFNSLIATINRLRDDVKIYFLGNVLSPENPYFKYYGIDGFSLVEGHTYVFTDYSTYSEPCEVGLEYGKRVTEKVEDIPKLLRTKGNQQVTGMSNFDLPASIIDSDDWLLHCLDAGVDVFEHFFQVKYKLRISVDETKKLIKNDNGTFKFDYIEYYYIFDKSNKKIYLVKAEPSDSYGLYLAESYNVPLYKLADEDIRNELPLLQANKLIYPIIYGDIQIYRYFKERIEKNGRF
mgnify:CR=1 FL=1|jgi:hypothetical protein